MKTFSRRRVKAKSVTRSVIVEAILLPRHYPKQGYRSCLGIVRLENHYPRERIEAAANRALTFKSLSYRSLKSILAKGLDRFIEEHLKTPSLFHDNIRGDSLVHSIGKIKPDI